MGNITIVNNLREMARVTVTTTKPQTVITLQPNERKTVYSSGGVGIIANHPSYAMISGVDPTTGAAFRTAYFHSSYTGDFGVNIIGVSTKWGGQVPNYVTITNECAFNVSVREDNVVDFPTTLIPSHGITNVSAPAGTRFTINAWGNAPNLPRPVFKESGTYTATVTSVPSSLTIIPSASQQVQTAPNREQMYRKSYHPETPAPTASPVNNGSWS